MLTVVLPIQKPRPKRFFFAGRSGAFASAHCGKIASWRSAAGSGDFGAGTLFLAANGGWGGSVRGEGADGRAAFGAMPLRVGNGGGSTVRLWTDSTFLCA
jgi:hypothetical protein